MPTMLEYMSKGSRRKTYAQIKKYVGFNLVAKDSYPLNNTMDISLACKIRYMNIHLSYKMLPNFVHLDGCELVSARTIDRST